ncbi:thioesterase family protein [Treponema endosymbiont of Eucomonympha sp.]|uniref:thioesterase family protein n=1 Tax=Treponema endosymbiont of Eucomonympha sp. TaxID=1580831 RepID=UPI000782486B|nr:thioesterase family protein [Treponema endosymbiont of Eucomonympha sp.]
MNFGTVLQPGLRGEKTTAVTEQNTARSLGSGGLAVFATPSLVALIEGACVQAVDGLLPEGYSTVGTDVRVKHLAATPVDMSVRAEGELTEVDGRRLVFRVVAFDGAGKIGEGTHERFIVDNGKFLAKAEAKRTEAAAVCGDR